MAKISIGTIFIGKVDRINQQSIQTKFFMLGLPLFPLESYYCLGLTKEGFRGFRIKLNFKSVYTVYMRWWVGVVSFLSIIFAIAKSQYVLLFLSALGVILTLSTIWIGRLTKKEANRRKVLINIVGIGAHPRTLTNEMNHEIRTKLELKWIESTTGTQMEDWGKISSASSIPSNLLPLLFCLSLYANEVNIAKSAWLLLETNFNRN